MLYVWYTLLPVHITTVSGWTDFAHSQPTFFSLSFELLVTVACIISCTVACLILYHTLPDHGAFFCLFATTCTNMAILMFLNYFFLLLYSSLLPSLINAETWACWEQIICNKYTLRRWMMSKTGQDIIVCLASASSHSTHEFGQARISGSFAPSEQVVYTCHTDTCFEACSRMRLACAGLNWKGEKERRAGGEASKISSAGVFLFTKERPSRWCIISQWQERPSFVQYNRDLCCMLKDGATGHALVGRWEDASCVLSTLGTVLTRIGHAFLPGQMLRHECACKTAQHIARNQRRCRG